MRYKLNDEGERAKQRALNAFQLRLDSMLQSVSADVRSDELWCLVDLDLASELELYAVVRSALDRRVSEIKNQWTEGDWKIYRLMWAETAAIGRSEA